jgi:ribosome-interacting GTPase 1
VGKADDVVDATKTAEQKRMLEIELEAVGIRLNTTPPDVVFRQKSAGGITVCPFLCRYII